MMNFPIKTDGNGGWYFEYAIHGATRRVTGSLFQCIRDRAALLASYTDRLETA